MAAVDPDIAWDEGWDEGWNAGWSAGHTEGYAKAKREFKYAAVEPWIGRAKPSN